MSPGHGASHVWGAAALQVCCLVTVYEWLLILKNRMNERSELCDPAELGRGQCHSLHKPQNKESNHCRSVPASAFTGPMNCSCPLDILVRVLTTAHSTLPYMGKACGLIQMKLGSWLRRPHVYYYITHSKKSVYVKIKRNSLLSQLVLGKTFVKSDSRPSFASSGWQH